MTPNIEKEGAKLRRILGFALLGDGIIVAGLYVWLLPYFHWLLAIAVLFLAAGSFALYEAKKQWCALRACGIRTPL